MTPKRLFTYLFVIILLLSMLGVQVIAQNVVTLAGNGTAGFLDGADISAQFNSPREIVVDASGNIYVADRVNQRIRMITPAGVVSTVAGNGTAGGTNGIGTAAKFNEPTGIALDVAAGILYVTDRFGHRVRKIIIASGSVSTLAGSSIGTQGYTDATGTSALFDNPMGLALDGSGNLYVADWQNNCIRKVVTSTGVVTTIIGNGTAGFADATGTSALLNAPTNLCINGNFLYVSDAGNFRIRKVDLTTLAVTTLSGTGIAGTSNGAIASAQFANPSSLAIDGTGNILYVADADRIRKIDILGGVVTTSIGTGIPGFADGSFPTAQFNNPRGLALDAAGNIYIADADNNRIRRTVPAPTITGFTPTTAVSGATVTINGTNLTGATAVTFGGVAAASYTMVSATQITAVVASGGTSGVIAVTTPGGSASSASAFTFIPPPTITSSTPMTAASGATVTINGTNLTGATAVSFGGVAAASFTVVSANQITAVVASGGASGAVTVTTPSGTTSDATAFTFIPAPTISSFTPATAAGGATVTINGANFTMGTTSVTLGGVAAAITSMNANQINVTVSSGGASGAVVVTTPGGITSAATAFTFIPAPTMAGYGPATAASGATVTINGTNFTGATAVKFGGVAAASYTIVSANQITAVVSSGGASGNVVVMTPGGTGTASGFTFIPSPTITGFTPLTAASGATVTINGTNFTGATAVSFGGVAAASFTIVNANQITAVVSSGGAIGAVSVTTPGGMTSGAAAFTFIPPPTITNFTPTNGGIGTTITINGTNFGFGVWGVDFGGTAAATYTTISPTQITADVSIGASGNVSVTTPGGTATLSGFTFNAPVPTITSFTPTSSALAGSVTIYGTGFTGATAVSFGGTPATMFWIVSSTQISAQVAAGASGSVSVTTPGGTATMAGFTYIPPPPTITSFTPLTAASGATVTINGTNFTGATIASFGGIDAASYTVVSANQITAIIAAGGSSGLVSVTTLGGTANSVGAFTFIPPPTITSFMPLTAASGATVTINGTNFTGATAVSFGGVAAASYTVVSANQITAVVDSGGASGAVAVTTPGGTTSAASTFTFTPPPSIGSFTPMIAASGATVTINGANFTGATAVSFGGVAAASYTVVSAVQITAVVAAGGASGAVTVTAPGGTTSCATAFAFASPPTITGFTPLTAASGATVTINGTNLTGTTAVSFGGTAAASYTVVSANQITAVVASGGASGAVTVTTPGGTTSDATAFTFIPPPTISGFLPIAATTGATITINGTNLTGTTAVSFGGVPAGSVTVVSPNQITAVVASGGATGNVVVTTPGGTATASGFVFMVNSSITSFTPSSAASGVVITITGLNFSGATAVNFGGVAAASFTVDSPTQISAVVGSGGASGNVSVTTPVNTATVGSFTFIPGPVIGSISPLNAASGSVVTITGAGLSGATAVSFGGVPAASYTVVSPTQITAIVGAGTSGTISVTTPGGIATSSGFVFIPGPVIYAFTPTQGGINTSVMLSGENFIGGMSVRFGGVSNTSLLILSSTQAIVTVGAGASGNVSVTTLGGTDSKPGFTFIPSPTITGFTPAIAASGATVTITGTNFVGVDSVRFGGIAAASFMVLSPTTIEAVVAWGGASGNVSVSTIGGTASVSGFTFVSPPTITGFTPTMGTSGTIIDITGTNFSNVTAVRFGGVSATSYTVVSPTQISAFPGFGASGNVSVTTLGGTASVAGFTFIYPPTITNFTPMSAASGATVTINGTNFSTATAVSFGGMPATKYTVLSPTQITAVVDNGTSGNVTVTTLGGTTSIGGFSFLASPTLTSFSPVSATVGTIVTLRGSNFQNVVGVFFGGIPAKSFTIVSSSQITAIVGIAANGNVTIITDGGIATQKGFTFISTSAGSNLSTSNTVTVPSPNIASFTPTMAQAGVMVRITGTNFVSVNAVSFGGIPAASFVVLSPTIIEAVVASGGASGDVSVSTANGMISLPGFTFISPPTMTGFLPTITGFNPSLATSGTVIDITGTHFVNVTGVRFGGISAASYQVMSANRISAILGAGASGSVTVTTLDGTASLSGFTVIAPPTVVTPIQAPTLTSFFPVQATSGTMITLSGTNFRDVTGVSFGGVAASSFTVVSANQIIAVVGSGGSGTVTVSSLHGSASSGGFTYLPPPMITEISPPSALRLATVTLYGANFTGATGVSFGGAQTTKFAVISPTEMVVRVPATAVSGSITVTTPNGTGAIAGFTVIYPPTITSFTPTNAATGTLVTIRGTDFTGSTAVRFGGVPAASFTVISPTEIRAVVGVGASGDVMVTATGGTASMSGFRLIDSPTMVSFVPSSAGAGTMVLIRGTNFGGALSVSFGGITARTFTVISPTEIHAIVGAGASGDVVVNTTRGTASAAGFTYIAAPTITGFTPTSASAGSAITITGTNFTGVTSVSFGGMTAASFTVISPTEIRAVVGVGSGGVVTVVASGGTVSSENMPGRTFVFLSPPDVSGSSGASGSPLVPPTVRGFSPAVAGKDRIVTILGANFSNVSSVKFGGTESARFTIVSPSQLTAVVSSGASGEVTVTNSAGTGRLAGFTFVPSPMISSFTPESGAIGTQIMIRGQNLLRVNRVLVGGVSVPFVVKNGGEISVTIPLSGASSGFITLVSPGGMSVSSQSFAFTPPPSITSASISQSRQGVILRITGANFLAATTVTIGETEVAFTVLASSDMTASVPSGVLPTDTVRVFTPGGMAISVGAPALPSITGISPERGAPGTRVVVSGRELDGTTQVSIGGAVVPFAILPSGEVSLTIPPSEVSGIIGLTTPFGVVTTTSSFTFIGSYPTIVSFSPTHGDVGTDVRITGENLGSPLGVYLGGKSLAFRSVSPTELQVTIPPTGAVSGSVVVVTPSGIAVSDEQFTLTSGGVMPSGITTVQARCYPNPASEYVTISYIVEQSPKDVVVRLFDASGRVLNVLPQGTQEIGEHFVSMSVKNLSPGAYPVSVEIEDRRLHTVFVISR